MSNNSTDLADWYMAGNSMIHDVMMKFLEENNIRYSTETWRKLCNVQMYLQMQIMNYMSKKTVF